ncbi:virulence factor SrfC family protein [Azospirillum sp. TSO22-1]|uniref:virulence factor SrfC family protein n=1 Tax=Azospirillum sp. TSO22-1 TaxID=716789 RepID=UPI000D61381D|nr:virulence factor SrfC family protein [Azospirillum sp. TSO22-1]PWC40178.1 hypothetical protein TSO221_25745 [Azospirillum sp. TSO22-1]
MTFDGNPLPQACQDAHDAAGQAAGWIAATRAESPRLDREADGLTQQLLRSRNHLRRLRRTVERPLAVGFFGESQVGKSYLVSVLAAGANGRLETRLGPDRLDFLENVNPVGHGKEATGLVTRFTCRPGGAPASHPVEVRLLSEADVIKILGNSYYRDFDQQTAVPLPEAAIRDRLNELRGRAQPQPAGGLSAEDVIDVMDYFAHHFRASMERYTLFWRTAADLAPRLAADDRARLFALLWQDVAPFTECYRTLQAALAALGHAESAHCRLSALVERKPDGSLAKERGIVNVQTLWQLGKDGADRVGVLPADGGAAGGAEVALQRSVLAALVAELRFVLAEPPAAELVERVDLLDFPGYRGRLAVSSIEEVGSQARTAANADPMAELFLRGKVAYLFERYTADQEMNLLLLCVASSRQPEVAAVKDAASAWVRQTQGATPEERRRRAAGLFFVITRFDEKVAPMAAETAESRRLIWSDLMKMALEKIGAEEWVANWNGRPFNNTFLTRKPRLASTVVALEDGRETGFLPGQPERLAELRRTFLEETLVRDHVAEAHDAWDAVMTLDDGGAGRLIAKLTAAADPAQKTGRVAELLAAECRRLRDGVGSFYSGTGTEEVTRKEQAFDALLRSLDPGYLGAILASLYPSAERLRALYFGAGEKAETAPAARAPRGRADLSALMSGGGAAGGAAPRARSGRAVDFAREVMREWQQLLREFPDDEDLLRHLGGLPRETALFITRELLTAAATARLEERIVTAIEAAEANAGAQWEAMVDRQVLASAMVIGRFIDDFGMQERAPSARPLRPDGVTPIFTDPPPAGAYPDLPEEETTSPFIFDWLLALKAAAIENVGHSEASEISSHANRRLGEILARVPVPDAA